MIRHVVTWKLAELGTDEREAVFDRFVEGFGSLPPIIPEIKSLWVGRDLGETEGNWDVVLIIDFETTEGIDVYQNHPEHKKVAAFVRTVAENRSAVDFEL